MPDIKDILLSIQASQRRSIRLRCSVHPASGAHVGHVRACPVQAGRGLAGGGVRLRQRYTHREDVHWDMRWCCYGSQTEGLCVCVIFFFIYVYFVLVGVKWLEKWKFYVGTTSSIFYWIMFSLNRFWNVFIKLCYYYLNCFIEIISISKDIIGNKNYSQFFIHTPHNRQINI